jgi:flavin-dependent dehydrogenase
MYDIAIVGAGPAGATLARLVGKRFKVLLLEKRSFHYDMPPSEEKSCGGLLDPDAQRMMARFGLGIPKSVLLSPQMFAVRTIDIGNSIERFYQRHYINIDRNEFDKWLEAIIPPSVTVINQCIYRSYDEQEDGIIIRFNHSGKEYEEKARLLVGADGAFSLIRRQGFPDMPAPKLYVTIQEWFEASETQNYYGAIFDEEITDFYSWTIPKEDRIILGTALSPGDDLHCRFELLKKKLLDYGYRFDKALQRNGAYMYRPVRRKQICTGGGRIALVGEAAGLISPSSAEGISYAFKSALALAQALEQDAGNHAALYSKNLKPLIRNIVLKNLKCPAMYNKFLRRCVMKSGLMSIDIVKKTR